MNNDVHTLTGAYVLDALSEMERRDFEGHMSGCPACQQEVAELRETTARLGTATAAAPPPQLWHKVHTTIGSVRQRPPLSLDEPLVFRPKRRTAKVEMFAAAASLVVAAAVSVGWVVTNSEVKDQLAQTRTELTKLQAVLASPDAKITSATASNGGTATAVVSKSQNGMVMLLQGMPALQGTQVYQAWYITPAGKATSAGILAASSGSVPADDLTPATGADKLGLTVEPAGGSAAPSAQPLVTVPI